MTLQYLKLPLDPGKLTDITVLQDNLLQIVNINMSGNCTAGL